MARKTIRERRQERAEQSAQCAKWGSEFLAANPTASKKQVMAHVEGKARAAGFDWASLIGILLQLLAQWFGK